MDNFLQIKHINKTFNPGEEIEVVALCDVSLDINSGDFVVLSGPSGSGKTTLLNIIGGLDAATSGEVVLDGQRLTGLPENALSKVRRDHIGFVFQAYNLIPVLTARENIEYVMRLQGQSSQKCNGRSQDLSRRLGIDVLLGKLPNQLSGGQQQRVAVARAVAATPKLILADEPTANLDSKTAESLMDMMQSRNQEEGVTIIFYSHDTQVIGKAKRSIVLKDGEVTADDRVC